MTNARRGRPVRVLHEHGDCYTLLDVEDIGLSAPVLRLFSALLVPMQVQDVDVVECLHQLLTHPAEGRVVEVGVVGDEGEDAGAAPLDSPLPETYELDVVVLEPLGVAFSERFAVHEVVVLHLLADPGATANRLLRIFRVPLLPPGRVRRLARVRRIAEYDENGAVALDPAAALASSDM